MKLILSYIYCNFDNLMILLFRLHYFIHVELLDGHSTLFMLASILFLDKYSQRGDIIILQKMKDRNKKENDVAIFFVL